MCTITVGADLAKRFSHRRNVPGQGTSGANAGVARGACAVAGPPVVRRVGGDGDV